MRDKTELIRVKSNLEAACDALHVAYWTENDFHIKDARERLVKAICCDNDATLDDLADLLGQAFIDGQDIDATTHSIGMCAARAILDTMAPKFPKPVKEVA